ncbi:MAG: nitrite reductase [Actinobacteria bacterium]|nr:nitrite reductase [Actinomycetota bacterium]
MSVIRERADRCPGAYRPWPAEDGWLVRLRLVGGRISKRSLSALSAVAQEFGDGRVYLTGRANLQVRAFPGSSAGLSESALAALRGTGLLPSRTHELARNIMLSPQSGLAGGRADLRFLAADLDRLICVDPVLAALPGRFLFVLDDGRGDLLDRPADLGLVALDHQRGQVRIGAGWAEVVSLDRAALRLAALAAAFLHARGSGASAPWHIRELAAPAIATSLAPVADPDPLLPRPLAPLPYGPVPGGRHQPAPETGLDGAAIAALTGAYSPTDLTATSDADDHPTTDAATTTTDAATDLIVTPWRGILIPEGERHE